MKELRIKNKNLRARHIICVTRKRINTGKTTYVQKTSFIQELGTIVNNRKKKKL